ncbi:MAG: type IV pilus secretin PilQ [Deltaproteobacteria bacterium]|nr:type IV pilus secretin PilQ [Deltaproteobacteria bacterium]
MKNPKRKRMYWGVVLIPIILLVMGCAPRKKVEPLPKAVPQNLIKDIEVVDRDEGKRVVIQGESPLVYTFFKLIPQPLKLVVDIPQTGLAKGVPTPLAVGDEVIKEIVATEQDGNTEIYICLNKLVRYQVQKEGNLLYIDVGKQSPLLAKEEKKKEIEIVEEVPPPAKEEVAAKELAPAQSLVDVSVDKSQKDKVIMKLKADGRLGDYDTFALKKPTRLVIDLWKVKRKFPPKAVLVNSPYLKKVRLGDHPKKVRVVLDVPTKVLPPHRIDRIGDELRVVLGKEVEVPVPKKEVAKEEKVPPLVPVTGEITGIDFKQLKDKSRIIITTSAKAPYEVVKGSEDTVLVEVKGMVVPPRLSRPLDTHEFASPVVMITPTNMVIDAQKGARVLVKLRRMVAYDVQQEDSRIYLDFERPEEFRVKKPKPLEVVTVKKPAEVEEVEKPVAVERPKVAPPTPVRKVVPVIPPPEEELERKVYTGKRITLDFKDADIDNILRLFAEVSNLNIITTEDVKGKVTVRLVDVPWDQALDIILQAKNLGMESIGNVIRIAPLERLRKEKEARVKAIKAKEELEPLISELIPVSYSTAAELAPKVKDLLSARGSVIVDERTNTLIIKDIRINVQKAKDLVRKLDAQTPQILIQAKIVEASTNFARELGISWGGHYEDETREVKGEVTGASSGDFVVDLPAAVGSGAGGALEFLVGNLPNTKYLRVKLSAMEDSGEGQVISSPRVTTLDHIEAYIEQGLRVPYLKITEEGTVTTEFIEANLKLTVTPHVTADGHIKMEILTSKDTPDWSHVVQGVPSIDKKEAKTEVLVKDGEVVVIGGIYTYEKTGGIQGVPLFHKIPLLGWLFKKKTKDEDKKELLIFIAPRIIQPRRITAS